MFAGALDRGRVEAEDGDRVARPQAVGDGAVADQLHAVEHAGLAAEVRLRQVGAVPREVLEPVDGDVAVRRRAAWPAGASARAARPARRRRTARCAGRSPSVRRVTVSLPWPRSVVHSVGSPSFQLPPSAITITSARSSSGSRRTTSQDLLAAVLLGALDDHLHAHGRVEIELLERAEMGDDARLVVGGAAAVEAPVAQGRRERARPTRARAGRRSARRAGRSARRRARTPRRCSAPRRAPRSRARPGRATSRAPRPRPTAPAGSPERRSRGSSPAARGHHRGPLRKPYEPVRHTGMS